MFWMILMNHKEEKINSTIVDEKKKLDEEK